MTTFNFDTPTPPHPDSAKARKYRGTNIIPLWVADMDFPAAPPILEALAQRVHDGRLGYSLPPDSTTQALIAHFATRHQITINPDHIVYRPGTVVALHAIAKTLLEPNEEILALTPVYPPFLEAPLSAGRLVKRVPLLLQNNTWQIDFDSLTAAITPGKTKAIYLCHPHNPIARQWTQSEVEALDQFTQRHNLLAVWDELHCDLLLNENTTHFSSARLPAEGAQNRILLVGPTKTFNLAGLGISAAIIPNPALRQKLSDLTHFDTPLVGPLSFTACEAAYRLGTPWLDALLPYLRDNRNLLLDFTRTHLAPNITIDAPIDATYLAWLNVSHLRFPTAPAPISPPLGPPPSDAAAFFESHGLGLMPGEPFGTPNSHLRLNFALPRPTLQEALTRMQKALAAIPSQGKL